MVMGLGDLRETRSAIATDVKTGQRAAGPINDGLSELSDWIDTLARRAAPAEITLGDFGVFRIVRKSRWLFDEPWLEDLYVRRDRVLKERREPGGSDDGDRRLR